MNILIVDDEPPARIRLRQLIEEDGQHAIVGEAGNGQEALEIAAMTTPDVVLLDIRMPGIDGIETAHHLNKIETPPSVVFTTAYDEYAIEAFEANAVGYVLKPVRREKLALALAQAAKLNPAVLSELRSQPERAEQRRHVCARVHGELRLIPVADVIYFVADQKYVSVVHKNGRDLIDDSLRALEDEFEEQFVRIHRSALIALDAIDSLTKTPDGRTRIVLRNESSDDDLYVSRRHVAEVKRRLKKG